MNMGNRRSVYMIKADEKQQELLERFFKEETTWQAEHVGYAMIAWIFIGISIIFFLIPFQEWPIGKDRNIRLIMYGMELIGITYSIQKYRSFSETGKVRQIYEILKTMPINYEQLTIFKLRKVFKTCLILTGITLFSQLLFALTCFHTVSLENILIPVISQLLIPMVYIFIQTRFK